MKTVQLSDNELHALDGAELRRLLERCYRPRARPRRKDDADDQFGDMEILHGHLSILEQLAERLLTIPADGVSESGGKT